MTVRLAWGVGGNAESYCEGQMPGVGSTSFQPNSNKDSSAGMAGKGNIIWILLRPARINSQHIHGLQSSSPGVSVVVPCIAMKALITLPFPKRKRSLC